MGIDQDIIDGYVLVQALHRYSTVEQAFQEFQQRRYKRAREIEKMGKQMSSMELNRSWLKRVAIDNMIKLMHSSKVLQKASKKMWKEDAIDIHWTE
jgi:2-polyprenyl-6-methoxyphenol hydroxylase-like FAD-dependent oxidoreductase